MDSNNVNGTLNASGSHASMSSSVMGISGGMLAREMHDNQGFEGNCVSFFRVVPFA